MNDNFCCTTHESPIRFVAPHECQDQGFAAELCTVFVSVSVLVLFISTVSSVNVMAGHGIYLIYTKYTLADVNLIKLPTQVSSTFGEQERGIWLHKKEINMWQTVLILWLLVFGKYLVI